MDDMTTLQSTKCTLKFLNTDPWCAYYRAKDEDRPDFKRLVVMDNETYEELGRPLTITVTIEPGDRLNG